MSNPVEGPGTIGGAASPSLNAAVASVVGTSLKTTSKQPALLVSSSAMKAVYTDGVQFVDGQGNLLYGPYVDRLLSNPTLQWLWRCTEQSIPSNTTPNITDLKGGVVLTATNTIAANYQQPGLLPGGGLGLINPALVSNPDCDPSYFFNTSACFVAASAIWSPSVATPWTVMFAVHPAVTRSGGATDYIVWSNRDSANNYGGISIGLSWTTVKTVVKVTMCSLTNAAHFNQCTSSADLLNTSTYFIAVSFNGNAASANNGISIQVNGLLDTTSISALLGADSVSSAVAVNLGRQNAASPSAFHGNIDELAVFTSQLSTSEIAYLHGLGMGVPQLKPLVYPLNIIYDDDCADDSDNLMGYAFLHRGANLGLWTIQAMTVVDGFNYSAAVVQAINNYYGRGNIPLGMNQASLVVTNHFQAQTVAAAWGTSAYTQASFGAAGNIPVTILRRALANNIASGTKAVIVGNGYFTNLSALLNSAADSISPLTGSQLISQATTGLVVGAGRWPSNLLNAFQSTPEFNCLTDIAASQNVFSNWPVPITIVGVEMGDYSPASPLSSSSPYYNATAVTGNILQYIWNLSTDLTNGQRGSWDSLPLLYLLSGGVGSIFDYGGTSGTVTIDGSGNNLWTATPGNCSYLRCKLTPQQLSVIIYGLFNLA